MLRWLSVVVQGPSGSADLVQPVAEDEAGQEQRAALDDGARGLGARPHQAEQVQQRLLHQGTHVTHTVVLPTRETPGLPVHSAHRHEDAPAKLAADGRDVGLLHHPVHGQHARGQEEEVLGQPGVSARLWPGRQVGGLRPRQLAAGNGLPLHLHTTQLIRSYTCSVSGAQARYDINMHKIPWQAWFPIAGPRESLPQSWHTSPAVQPDMSVATSTLLPLETAKQPSGQDTHPDFPPEAILPLMQMLDDFLLLCQLQQHTSTKHAVSLC